MSMTLDELRDWHARRRYVADIPSLSQKCRDGWDAAYFRRLDDNEMHPFQPTLDAADASMPPNCDWERANGYWYASPSDGTVVACITVNDTGDKPRDLYELSKLAWEQEAAR
jgi:hypothetical protein